VTIISYPPTAAEGSRFRLLVSRTISTAAFILKLDFFSSVRGVVSCIFREGLENSISNIPPQNSLPFAASSALSAISAVFRFTNAKSRCLPDLVTAIRASVTSANSEKNRAIFSFVADGPNPLTKSTSDTDFDLATEESAPAATSVAFASGFHRENCESCTACRNQAYEFDTERQGG